MVYQSTLSIRTKSSFRTVSGPTLHQLKLLFLTTRVCRRNKKTMTNQNTSTEQKLYGVAPYLIVDDIFLSAEFYRDKLGFNFDRIWGEPPQFVIVHRDGVQIMLKGLRSPGNIRPNSRVNPDACWDFDVEDNSGYILCFGHDIETRSC